MLSEKKAQYFSGKIEKNKYMDEMFSIHKSLFEYPVLLQSSPLKKIEIDSQRVTFIVNSLGKILKLCCDEKDAHALPMSLLNFAEYEAEESAMVLNLIQPGNVVFDIGANIGWYTLNILLHRPESVVYSFEPIKSSFEYLKTNLRLNSQEVSSAYNFGLGDENKLVEFYFDIKNSTASSLADLRGHKDTVKEKCQIKRLDDFVASLPAFNRLDFIKCDVEGAELFVFQGAKKSISQYRPIIFAEMLRKWAKKFGYHPNDIIQLLRELDYDCYVIKAGKLMKFGLVNDETLERNYLFFHRDKHQDLVEALLVV